MRARCILGARRQTVRWLNDPAPCATRLGRSPAAAKNRSRESSGDFTTLDAEYAARAQGSTFAGAPGMPASRLRARVMAPRSQCGQRLANGRAIVDRLVQRPQRKADVDIVRTTPHAPQHSARLGIIRWIVGGTQMPFENIRDLRRRESKSEELFVEQHVDATERVEVSDCIHGTTR